MAKKVKMLLFGGTMLPKGKLTWYERLRPGDEHGAQGLMTVHVFPGDMVPAEVVYRDTGRRDHEKCDPCLADLTCGVAVLEPSAESYVKRHMASYAVVDVEEEETKP